LAVFLVWIIINMYAFEKAIKVFAQNYGRERKEVARQLKTFLPALPQKAVFYFETDGQGPFGNSLPFFTSVPQALTVIYYDSNSLPDSFFEKPLFAGRTQGYQFLDDRGFGYYTSKRNLVDDLLLGKFMPFDIHAFYYSSKNTKLIDTSYQIRRELEEYLLETDKNYNKWKRFISSTGKWSLMYPDDYQISQKEDFIEIRSPAYNYKLSVLTMPQNFNLSLYLQTRNRIAEGELVDKRLVFDKFHFNDVYLIQNDNFKEYYVVLKDTLFYLTYNRNAVLDTDEVILTKILGSLNQYE